MDYKKQYLKYKIKYLNAKKTIGGSTNHYMFKSHKFINVLEELNNTFLTYFVRNYNHHQGDDVSDHVIWTALVVVDWIKKKSNWIKNIDSKYHEILVFTAFIHDIGKTGDGDYTSLIKSSKPTHHEDGVDILMGKKRYITYSNDINAAQKSTLKNPHYTDNRIIKRTTGNALHNIREYSTNIEVMFKTAGFTSEHLLICAMIVGMVDEFDELVLESLKNTQSTNKNNSVYLTYKMKFDGLLSKLKLHYNPSNIIDKDTLVRMCIAISAANRKGNVLIKGQLHNLPIPNTVYLESLTENKFKDFDKNYLHIENIINAINNKKYNSSINNQDEQKKTSKTKVPKDSKKVKKYHNNSNCSIQ